MRDDVQSGPSAQDGAPARSVLWLTRPRGVATERRSGVPILYDTSSLFLHTAFSLRSRRRSTLARYALMTTIHILAAVVLVLIALGHIQFRA